MEEIKRTVTMEIVSKEDEPLIDTISLSVAGLEREHVLSLVMQAAEGLIRVQLMEELEGRFSLMSEEVKESIAAANAKLILIDEILHMESHAVSGMSTTIPL